MLSYFESKKKKKHFEEKMLLMPKNGLLSYTDIFPVEAAIYMWPIDKHPSELGHAMNRIYSQLAKLWCLYFAMQIE